MCSDRESKVENYVDDFDEGREGTNANFTSHFSFTEHRTVLSERKWNEREIVTTNVPVEVVDCKYQCFGRDLGVWNLNYDNFSEK